MILSKCLSSLCTVGITFISTQYNEPSIMTRCTPSIEPGITVTVSDFQTRLPLAVKVIVNDNHFQEELQLSGVTATGNIIYGGVFERPGVYTVSISRDGYKTSVLEIEVTKGECHVITRNIHVRLNPINCD